MSKYRDKSDFEINKAVAEELIQSGFIIGVEYHDKHILVMDKYANNYPFDPCNNPADAMPIIIENKICMAYDVFAEERDGGNWVAQPAYGFSDERVRSDSYYRAAMICFLMMKDAENEKS
ncbi:phage protein NinX family protein [Morganella morganii]|uniref:phage protein NinX family protein n=1 Tax=Morganella morganii TaxID=582 RepID=UPI003EB7BC14